MVQKYMKFGISRGGDVLIESSMFNAKKKGQTEAELRQAQLKYGLAKPAVSSFIHSCIHSFIY